MQSADSVRVFEELEERWEEADLGATQLENLQGRWRVKRLTGPLPMPRVWKAVSGAKGETRFGPSPGLPFELKQRRRRVSLVYRAPLSFMVDELRLEHDGTWLGRATLGGMQYAWFTMTPLEAYR